jgi:hypothetical protein
VLAADLPDTPLYAHIRKALQTSTLPLHKEAFAEIVSRCGHGEFLGECIVDGPLYTAKDVDEAADRLAALPIEDLQRRIALLDSGRGGTGSETREARVTLFARKAIVVAYGKARAGYRCEIPDCSHPTFETSHGRPCCEVHHIVPLAVSGEDIPQNTVCLCPAHHREAHHGKNAATLLEAMQHLRTLTTA